jgi:ankyrin repeat protein
VQYGSFEISKLLLEAGADPTATTVDGTTPFEVTPNGDEDVVPLTGEQVL